MTATHIRTRRIVGLAALSCAILLAACGSTSKLHTPGADDHAAKQKFATCMRSHGVPNFPDLGTTASYHYMAQVNQSAPAFESAQKACAKYGNPMAPPAPPLGIPDAGARQARALHAHPRRPELPRPNRQ